MGKSPAKWIKAVLFGKKSGHASKARYASKATNDKGHNAGKGSPALVVNSPVISEPVLVSTDINGITPELENGPSNLDEAVALPTSIAAKNQESARPEAASDHEKVREEQAAIRVQAAFRGFLARRAFHALRGIIRLQALVRGHLVRRQAVATLCSMQGIVKLQALARGKKVRRSDIGLEISTKFGQRKAVDAKPLDSWKEKLATNAFISKLLWSSPDALPLHIRYDNAESNSVYIWLERWTSSRSWKPLSKPNMVVDSKSHNKKGNYAMETESGRPKRIVRRSSAGGIDSSPTNIMSEPEKPKRNMRKVSSSATYSVQDHPQTQLEKVKRNLRKVSNMTETSEYPAVEIEKPNRSLRKGSNTQSDAIGQCIEDSAEKSKKDVALAPEAKADFEPASKSVATEGPVDALLDDRPPVESHPLQSVDIEENLSVMNGDFISKEDQTCYDNQKTSNRRASFSAKAEHAENGLQNMPPLPSYMAATESAKAKLRAQGSPRFGSDSVDRSVVTRRHSLPSSTNGKVSSNSPRTQRLVQGSGKGSIKSDRSLVSSRDGNERPIQVEWRR